MSFYHLLKVRQSYKAHFKDALYYSQLSLQASYYFFMHALYPDIYTNHGSNTIGFLNHIIQKKLKNFNK